MILATGKVIIIIALWRKWTFDLRIIDEMGIVFET